MIWAKDDGKTLAAHLKEVKEWAEETRANPWAALFHDIGKIDLNFQKRLISRSKTPNVKDSQPEGIQFPHFKQRIRHEFLSVMILAYFGLRYNLSHWREALQDVLWHHRNVLTKIGGMTEAIYKEDFVPGLAEMLRHVFDIKDNVPTERYLQDFLNTLQQHDDLIIGLLKEAGAPPEVFVNPQEVRIKDYIKALEEGVRFFASVYQYDGHRFTISDKKFQKVREAGKLKRADYLGSALQSKTSYLDKKLLYPEELPSLEWAGWQHTWQYQVIKNLDKNKQLFLLEAPTGSGKTLFAYILAKELGAKRFIYVLPYRAALNEKYQKLRGNESKKELGLLHSTSILELAETDNYDTEGNYKQAIINAGIKESLAQHFFYPVILSTADQTQVISMEYFGADEQLSLYDKDTFLVLDEPQAFELEQQAIILKSIEMALKAGAKVLFMSATMPVALKQAFDSLSIDAEFIQVPREIKNYSLRRHRIELHDLEIVQKNKRALPESFIQDVREKIALSQDKKVLIILNHVDQALEMYEALKKANLGRPLYLLHSRLKWERKDSIVREVVESLGGEDKPWILVSTQVVEAAVDVDADVMFTLLSPLPSQVQRWGRVYRNRGDKDYSDPTPNIHVYYWRRKKGKNEEENPPATGDMGKIYSKESMINTLKILEQIKDRYLTYQEEKEIIERYYEQLGEIQRLLEWMEDLPLFASEVTSYKEAHFIFRPDDRSMSVVIEQELLEEGIIVNENDVKEEEKGKIYVKIRGDTGLDGHWVDKTQLLKMEYQARKDRIPSKWIVGEVLDYKIIRLPKYDKATLEEFGLDALFDKFKDVEEEADGNII